ACFPRGPLLADRPDRHRAAAPVSPPLGWRMPRNRGLILPLILIGIGVVVLLANTGVLSQQAVGRLGDLWPLLLVILGLQLILNHTLPRRQATLIGLAVMAVVVIAAVAYATLAPATSVGAQKVDASAQSGGLTAATLDLNDRIPWTIQVGGGATNLSLDLRHLQLTKLEVSGGANRMDAQLPAAKGTVMVEVSGGASNLTLRAPAETQWRIGVSGGANAVTINGSTSGALGGDFERQSPGYGTATNRYNIQISGGASHLDFRTS